MNPVKNRLLFILVGCNCRNCSRKIIKNVSKVCDGPAVDQGVERGVKHGEGVAVFPIRNVCSISFTTGTRDVRQTKNLKKKINGNVLSTVEFVCLSDKFQITRHSSVSYCLTL